MSGGICSDAARSRLTYAVPACQRVPARMLKQGADKYKARNALDRPSWNYTCKKTINMLRFLYAFSEDANKIAVTFDRPEPLAKCCQHVSFQCVAKDSSECADTRKVTWEALWLFPLSCQATYPLYKIIKMEYYILNQSVFGLVPLPRIWNNKSTTTFLGENTSQFSVTKVRQTTIQGNTIKYILNTRALMSTIALDTFNIYFEHRTLGKDQR